MVSIALTLSLCGVQGFVIDGTRHSVWRLLNYIFTFRFNIYPDYTGLPLPWKVLWSLSIEEVFYFSFPILFGALKRPRWIVPILIIVIVFGPFRRASGPGPKVLRVPELFGQFSYELYLFHSFVIVAVAETIAPVVRTWNHIALSYGSFGVVITVSFFASGAIAKAYSEPANKFIRRMLLGSSQRPKSSRPMPGECEFSALNSNDG